MEYYRDFFKAHMSRKDGINLKSYLSIKLNTNIQMRRVLDENVYYTIFSAFHKKSNKCLQYIYDHIDEINREFNIKGYTLDLRPLQIEEQD